MRNVHSQVWCSLFSEFKQWGTASPAHDTSGRQDNIHPQGTGVTEFDDFNLSPSSSILGTTIANATGRSSLLGVRRLR